MTGISKRALGVYVAVLLLSIAGLAFVGDVTRQGAYIPVSLLILCGSSIALAIAGVFSSLLELEPVMTLLKEPDISLEELHSMLEERVCRAERLANDTRGILNNFHRTVSGPWGRFQEDGNVQAHPVRDKQTRLAIRRASHKRWHRPRHLFLFVYNIVYFFGTLYFCFT